VLPVAADVVAGIGIRIRVVHHRGDVGAGRKRFVAARQDDHVDGRVGVELVKSVAQLVHHVVVQRVHRLRAVQADHHHLAVLLDQQVRIFHATPPYI
jgi:hypothetical protein